MKRTGSNVSIGRLAQHRRIGTKTSRCQQSRERLSSLKNVNNGEKEDARGGPGSSATEHTNLRHNLYMPDDVGVEFSGIGLFDGGNLHAIDTCHTKWHQ